MLNFLLLALFGVTVFASLGVWQLERRAWKLGLIEQVDARVHAPPVAAPGPAAWPALNARDAGYLHVRVTGHFLDGRTAFVRATTELGPGFWVLAPFRSTDGYTVLVNRGFIPSDRRGTAMSASGASTVTGLLRMTELGGAFLRANDPARDRWYSRDVAAIAASRGLAGVAPYFIDADAGPAGAWPRGGLTVVAFPNNHLVYAFTWFGLAFALVAATVAGWHENGRQTSSR